MHRVPPIESAIVVVLLALAMGGCADDSALPVLEANPEKADLAPFFESEFPFITSAMHLGSEGLLSENVAVRGITMRLPDSTYAVFDTDLLRVAGAWSGSKPVLQSMAHVSYDAPRNKKNGLSAPGSPPFLQTGVRPGWSAAPPNFDDRRETLSPGEPGRGPIADSLGRWTGIRLTNGPPVLEYEVRQTRVRETMTVSAGGAGSIVRSIHVDRSTEDLFVLVAEFPTGARVETTKKTATIGPRRSTEETNVLLTGLENTELQYEDDRLLVVKVPAGSNGYIHIRLSSTGQPSPSPDEATLDRALDSVPVPDRRWPWKVSTNIERTPDTAAYVVDEIPLPLGNPANRNIRVTDLDFFSDGSGAAVTYDGDVWKFSLPQEDGVIFWERFASGLSEPMSLAVVDDRIYTFGRDGIIELIDSDANGEADFHRNFSNLAVQTVESREFPSDMEAAPGGGFIISKGAAGDAGPKTSPGTIKGFRTGGIHSGTILRVSPDGRSVRPIATGFRQPFIGVDPSTGAIVATDQQGNSVPSTPVYLVKNGDYYGVQAAAHGADVTNITPPLTWVPHRVDKSSTGARWLRGAALGPLGNALVYVSYGEPAVLKVMIDEDDEIRAAGVTTIPVPVTVPLLNAKVHPTDGSLFLTGFGIWDTNADRISGIQRMRYTGLPSTVIERFQLDRRGVLLSFSEPLDPSHLRLSNFSVSRWNYERTEAYGSGHFKLNGSPGEDPLPVLGINLSNDQKNLFISIPGLARADQMAVEFSLRTQAGQDFSSGVYFTPHSLREVDLDAAGISAPSEIDRASAVPEGETEAEKTASVEAGASLFRQFGCAGCHSVSPSAQAQSAPSFVGLAGSMRTLTDSSRVRATSRYLRESIVDPAAKVVAGYEVGMGSYEGILDETDLTSLVLYIESIVGE